MTASHFQKLPPPGPVQLIGLPRTAMGVTSPRVLHRRMLVNNNNNNNNNNSSGISNAKRCLFGSPEPGEIKKLFREEMRKSRDHFIKRYNYDIVKEKFINENDNCEKIINNNEKSTNLKDDKLDDNNEKSCNNHEEIEGRLHEAQNDKHSSLPSNSLISNKNDSCDVTTCNLNNIHLLAVENDNNNTTIKTSPTELSEITTPSHKDRKTNERLKPYSRQILLTDYYNNRKVISTKTTAIIVRQLPKPQKAGLHEQSTIPIQHHQQQHQQQQQQQTEDV